MVPAVVVEESGAVDAAAGDFEAQLEGGDGEGIADAHGPAVAGGVVAEAEDGVEFVRTGGGLIGVFDPCGDGAGDGAGEGGEGGIHLIVDAVEGEGGAEAGGACDPESAAGDGAGEGWVGGIGGGGAGGFIEVPVGDECGG